MVYQQCISLNAHQEHPYEWMPYYTDCIDMVSPLCMTSDVDEDIPFVWNPRYTDGDWLHLYGFSPVCVLICRLRPPLYLKALSQWLHLYGFSPVCSIKWSSCAAFPEKALLHWLHWYGLSPVCILRGITKLPFCAKPCYTHCIYMTFLLCVSINVY